MRRSAQLDDSSGPRTLSAGLLALCLAAVYPLGPSLADVPSGEPDWLPDAARYDAPFFDGAAYDPAVKTPDEILGYQLGTRPLSHDELLRCLVAWRESARMVLREYARSHELRALHYAVITAPANHARIDAVRDSIGRLADPRKLSSDAEAREIISKTPAIAWMAYSIHGDELSSTDAAVALIYHLLACTDRAVLDLLDQTVVIVDPLMNPDGRERFLAQLAEFGGYTPSLDAAAMQHGGRWPWGRGNHYLFDLNRDWIHGVHPETVGRQLAVSRWNPQLFVDSHEMGAYDTYLFNPPREPFNPYMSEIILKWWERFAADQAAAFDVYGWSYYTREWLEMWYPGYSDSWASFRGSIGMLYEQAGVGGGAIVQPSGRLLTYRESVHHHLVSSIANLKSLYDNREEILTDFLAHAREALAVTDESPARSFLLRPGPNATRERAFLEMLDRQGIEIGTAKEAFTVADATDTLGNAHEATEFPAGTYVVPIKQPAGRLAAAILDFDPQMSEVALKLERESVETKRESKIYDVTGWSVPLAYAVDAYWTKDQVAVATEQYRSDPPPTGTVESAECVYAYVVDGADDSVCRALASLVQHDVQVRTAEKVFSAGGRSFAPGSLLIRRDDNGAELGDRVRQAAEEAHCHVYVAKTGRSPDDGPDLGGSHFILAHRPRVALFGDGPVNPTSYGEIWRVLDVDVGLSMSLISVGRGPRMDLRRYNVMIMPPVWGDAQEAYAPLIDGLKTWVEAGGTLIAIGNACGPLISKDKGISGVRRRRDVLPELAVYAYAVALERARGKTAIDREAVWGRPVETQPAEPPADAPEKDAKAEHADEWRRLFSPSGVILRGEVDREHWLTFGCPEELPVFFDGSTVLMSKHPVHTPVRFAASDRLRLSGLLWPEAAARIADSAYATVERVGNGQIILLASDPDFRGYFHGSRRLLINAVLLGPGCGTSQPVPAP